MNIKLISTYEVDTKELAKQLAKCSPEEFKSFWYSFYENVTDESLYKFAEAMAERLGSNRKKPLVRLYELMRYYEEVEKRKSEES